MPRAALALIGVGRHDRAVEPLDVVIVVRELRGQIVERFGVGAIAIGTHVVDRLIKAFADQLLPDPIDESLGEPGILFGRDPFGDRRATHGVGGSLGQFLAGEEEDRLHERPLRRRVFQVGHVMLGLAARHGGVFPADAPGPIVAENLERRLSPLPFLTRLIASRGKKAANS